MWRWGTITMIIVALFAGSAVFLSCGGGGGGGGTSDGFEATKLSEKVNSRGVWADDSWYVWSGTHRRSPLWFDGITVTDLSEYLDEDLSTIEEGFDGRYAVISVTDDITYRIYLLDTDDLGLPPVLIFESDYQPGGLVAEDGLAAWYVNDGTDDVIFACDITVLSPTAVQLSNNGQRYSITVENGAVVWLSFDGHDEEIFVYDTKPATPTLVQVTDDTESVSYIYLQVDGDIIKWGMGSPLEIYYYDLAAPAPSVVRVTNNSVSEYESFVANRVIAWQASDGDNEIYYYDIDAPAPTIVQVTDNSSYDYLKDLDAGVITWTRGSSLYYHDISSPTPTEVAVPGASAVSGVALDDGVIAWHASDGSGSEIYYYDINAPSPTVVQVTDNGMHDNYPVINQGQISWYGQTSDYFSKHYYYYRAFSHDTATSTTTPLNGWEENYIYDLDVVEGETILGMNQSRSWIYAMPLDSSQPPVRYGSPEYGHHVTGFDNGIVVGRLRTTLQDYEIFYCDLNAVAPTLTVITDNAVDDEPPQIDNGLIVWEAKADADNDPEIYYYDMNASVPTVTQLTFNTLQDSDPVVEDGVIVWTEFDGADNEIFYYDLNASLPVKTAVSVNDTPDSDPVISDGIVAWRNDDGMDFEIWYSDLGGAAVPVQLTDNDEDDYEPDTDGGIVVWHADTATDSEIFYFNTGAVAPTVLALTQNSVSDSDPVVRDGLVAWFNDTSDYEVYYYDFNASSPSPVQVTDNTWSEGRLKVNPGGIITWDGAHAWAMKP